MKFSEAFRITRSKDHDWFDPILSVDTRLFLDPFLVYSQEQGEFVGSHSHLIDFFNCIFRMVARSGGVSNSIHLRRALDCLQLGEFAELCLGYTDTSTRGSGSGSGLAGVTASAIWEAIQAGKTEIQHFEEIGIIREGIGADRISDLTAHILRAQLVRYTRSICERHKVPLSRFNYLRGIFNISQERWEPLAVDLPVNSYSGKAALLVPEKYLRDLPSISAGDFWDYCWSNENETIRREFGYDISKNVSKREIVALARKFPGLRARYLASKEARDSDPYNFSRDPKGLVKWYEATAEFVRHRPLALIITAKDDFEKAIECMIGEFRNYVENNRGWALLWNDNGTPRSEKSAQDLFLGVIKHYCMANDIDISREANIGRGPVDFKVSKSATFRALIELKLASNTKFWAGLAKQLPTYQKAEDIARGFFVVVVQRENDLERISGIQREIGIVRKNTGFDITAVIVDARANPPSASKV